MFRKVILNFAVLITLIAITAIASHAQATGGSITGEVLDANGAAVQNASVTLRNEANGQTLTAQTTGAGSTFPQRPVGSYTVTVRHQGSARDQRSPSL